MLIQDTLFFHHCLFLHTPDLCQQENCFFVASVVYKLIFFLSIKAVKISLKCVSSAMKLHLIVLSVFITTGMYIIGTVVKLELSKN